MDVTVVRLSRFDALEKVGGSTEVRSDIGDEVATDEIRADKRAHGIVEDEVDILILIGADGRQRRVVTLLTACLLYTSACSGFLMNTCPLGTRRCTKSRITGAD